MAIPHIAVLGAGANSPRTPHQLFRQRVPFWCFPLMLFTDVAQSRTPI